MNDTSINCSPDARRGRQVAAIVLLIVAVLALADRHLPFAWRDSSPLWLGLGFITWARLVVRLRC